MITFTSPFALCQPLSVVRPSHDTPTLLSRRHALGRLRPHGTLASRRAALVATPHGPGRSSSSGISSPLCLSVPPSPRAHHSLSTPHAEQTITLYQG